MAEKTHAPPIGWGRSAWYGAEAGLALAFLYALAFIAYAITRSTLNILATPDIDGGLAGTLIATSVALALPALVLAALASLLAALLGALTALVLRALLSAAIRAQRAWRAVAIGVALCLAVSLTLLAVLQQGLGLAWSPVVAATLTFWLILPLGTYVVAGGLAGWQVHRMFAA